MAVLKERTDTELQLLDITNDRIDAASKELDVNLELAKIRAGSRYTIEDRVQEFNIRT